MQPATTRPPAGCSSDGSAGRTTMSQTDRSVTQAASAGTVRPLARPPSPFGSLLTSAHAWMRAMDQSDRAMSVPAQDASPPPVTAGLWRRSVARLPRYGWSGTVMALLLAGSSFTPSLLPRSPILQGLLAGIVAAFGYGVGETRRVGSPPGHPVAAVSQHLSPGLAGPGGRGGRVHDRGARRRLAVAGRPARADGRRRRRRGTTRCSSPWSRCSSSSGWWRWAASCAG